MESNDSPEIPDRGGTSDILCLLSGNCGRTESVVVEGTSEILATSDELALSDSPFDKQLHGIILTIRVSRPVGRTCSTQQVQTSEGLACLTNFPFLTVPIACICPQCYTIILLVYKVQKTVYYIYCPDDFEDSDGTFKAEIKRWECISTACNPIPK